MMTRMSDQELDRGAPSALKGWLSDIYFPALVELRSNAKAIDPLLLRLGGKATVDDPVFGRATGLPAMSDVLKKSGAWLGERAASYERGGATSGIDRDVTEGTLAMNVGGRSIHVPVAVVAERRKSREVELRVYFSTQAIDGKANARPPLVGPSSEIVLPQAVADHADALRKGDVMGALACFEVDGFVRDSRGKVNTKAEGGLKEFYEKLFAGGAFSGGLEMQQGGNADDGRICAIEYTLTKVAGRDVPPQAGLMVYERGDSGLVRALRIYDDVC